MDNRDKFIPILRSFEIGNDRESYIHFFSNLFLFVTSLVGSIYFYQFNPWFSALFWFPIWLALCKFFVFVHDCGHYSLFRSKKVNRIVGKISGFCILLPNSMWNKIHNSHHEVTGNLDRRKNNPGVSIMTVKEFQNAPLLSKIGYRVMRSVFVRLLVIPISLMLVGRIPFPRLGWAIAFHIIIHDLIYAFLTYVMVYYDWTGAIIFIFVIPLFAFYSFAAILFFLQHQYEETYWAHDDEWDLYTASIQGSSYLKFGPLMNWVTGNVGCHHIHHLNSKIPFYNLKKATDQVSPLIDIKSIRLKDFFQHLSFVLWDEEQKKIVRFKNIN